MFRLFQINTVPAEHEEGSTWLELFFDLVYVAILVELGNRLSSNLTLLGALAFAALYVPIWWSWLGLVFYTRYFPADEIGQRLLTVLYMAAMIVLAFEIHSVNSETATNFILAYAATKFILALMYARAWYIYADYRGLTSHYVVIYCVLGTVWVLIALVAPNTYWLWGVVIAADVFAPVLIRFVRQLRNKPFPTHPPMKHNYMQHRFGELTIIVLGEFFIKLIAGSSGYDLLLSNFYMGACLLLISVSLWWLYFDHAGHTNLDSPSVRPAVWVYTHYFLLMAITAYGVVGTKVFVAFFGDILSQEKRMIMAVALAIAVLALGIIDRASPEKHGRMTRPPQLNIRIVAALILLLLGGLGGQVAVGAFITLVALVLVVQVGFDISSRLRSKDMKIP